MCEKIEQYFGSEREKQEKIQLLEKLNIGSAQKAEIILIFLGLKPAADLTLFKNYDSEEIVKAALAKVGLEFADKEARDKAGSVITDRDHQRKKCLAVISVARDQKTLKELLELYPNKDHEAYGRLMGYPETAVQAFTNKELLDSQTERELIGADGNIFTVKFSKDHWQEELELIKTWNQAIKKYAPDTYREARGRN